MKKKLGFALINGPVSKTHFLHGNYNGITEYLAQKTYKKNDEVMLIYNKLLSVCPITTHIPLKNVSKFFCPLLPFSGTSMPHPLELKSS